MGSEVMKWLRMVAWAPVAGTMTLVAAVEDVAALANERRKYKRAHRAMGGTR